MKRAKRLFCLLLALALALTLCACREDDVILPEEDGRGNQVGDKAYSARPRTARTGIIRRVLGILNLWEKKEKIRSTISWVTKLIRTSRPSRE